MPSTAISMPRRGPALTVAAACRSWLKMGCSAALAFFSGAASLNVAINKGQAARHISGCRALAIGEISPGGGRSALDEKWPRVHGLGDIHSAQTFQSP